MSKALATKNVAAVLLSAAMIFGIAFSFATPAKADVLSDLQAQVQALLAQIASLQGSGAGSQQVGGLACATFTRNLRQGATDSEVMALQKFLNSVDGTQVATTGAGSPGNETSYFGGLTKAAVIRFQEKFAADVLTPVGLSKGTGNWYASTRAKANSLCTTGGGPVTPPPPTTGGNLVVGAGAQPANSLAVESASRVPFTTFTLTNTSGAAVTVNSVTVTKSGLGNKAVFDGIVLVDEQGLQLGNAKTLNSNNQATLDAALTINPGQTKTLTVAGNMIADLGDYAGQVLGISVTGINTSATVSGSLPITGASHTMNSTLAIGGLQLAVGPLDPNTTSLATAGTGKAIGTTGFTFASVRATNTGSAEDQWVKSIRWNQSGSAGSSDLTNVVTVLDGTSYPTILSADGKYFTTVFPGNGIEIKKGLQKEFSVKGDIIGGPARTISFDIYKAADVYVVGATYGYGITPTAGTTASAGNDSQFTTGTPFFSATVVIVDAGTVSSVSRATEVAAQNIVILSPNQPLGGFAVDIKGEAVTVASLTFGFNTSAGDATDIDNVTLVDENGAVVAGPVDGATGVAVDGKVVFTDSVTFPTGRHIYTLKGQLDSSVTNGTTITASTTPNSTYWTSAKGSITGNSITISNSDVTGNTMTVRTGGVVASVNASPAAQTIVAGVSGQTVAQINLDATQSGEDVRFNSMKVYYTDGPITNDPTNCAIWDGATRLNDSTVNPATSGDDTYTFNTALIVSKGTVKTVAVKCDLSGSATSGTFSFGIDDTAGNTTFSGTGVTSSQTITPTTATGALAAGNTMTMSSGGALTVAADSSSPSYAIAAGGATGVTLGVLRFTGTNEALKLDRVALQMSPQADTGNASSSPGNLTQVYLYDGATQVGTAIFAGTRYATSTLSGNVMIPANGYKTIVVKGDLAAIGTGQAGTQGALIKVDYDDDDSTGTRAVGQSSGSTVNRTASADSTVSGVRTFRSYPTVAQVSGQSGTLQVASAVDLYRFSITANAAGDISVKKFVINLATTSASASSGTTTVDNLDLYAYTESSFSSPVSGYTSGLIVDGTAGTFASGNNTLAITSTSILTIPAGQTYYFKVVGDIAQVAGTSNSAGSVTTKLVGDTAFPASIATLMGAYATGLGNFVWSPNATTTSTTNHIDWTNGFGVAGLPSAGLTGTTLSK